MRRTLKKAFAVFTKAFEVTEYKLVFRDKICYRSIDGTIVNCLGSTNIFDKIIEIDVGATRALHEQLVTLFHEVLHAALDAAGYMPWWHHLLIDPLQEALQSLLENGEWTIPDSLADIENDEDLIIRGLRRLGLDDLVKVYLDTKKELE